MCFDSLGEVRALARVSLSSYQLVQTGKACWRIEEALFLGQVKYLKFLIDGMYFDGATMLSSMVALVTLGHLKSKMSLAVGQDTVAFCSLQLTSLVNGREKE